MENVTASYLTLCGSKFRERPRFNLVERAAAARQAGFTGIGVCADELAGLTPKIMDHLAAVLPVPVTELEWYDLAAPRKHTAKTLFAAARSFGATRVNAGVCGDWDERKGITVLRNFAEEAATYALDVAVEPVAFGPLWDPREVMALIDAAGQPNVGLLFDTWHMAYAMHDSQVPFQVPWDRIAEIQLAGSRGRGHGRRDAMERCLPGHATDEAQTAGWYRLFQEHCPQVPVSAEVTNTVLRANPVGLTAGLVMSALNLMQSQSRKG